VLAPELAVGAPHGAVAREAHAKARDTRGIAGTQGAAVSAASTASPRRQRCRGRPLPEKLPQDPLQPGPQPPRRHLRVAVRVQQDDLSGTCHYETLMAPDSGR